MSNKISILTGPIVGLKSSSFISGVVNFCASVDEKVICYDLFDEMLTLSGIYPQHVYDKIVQIGHILNGYSYQFQDLRHKAYLSIARKIDKLGPDVSVTIRLPASIEWRGYNLILKDHRFIAEHIRPDSIITLINAEWKIKDNLYSKYGKHVLKLIAHRNEISLTKILEWLASEVSVSEDWAEWISHITGKNINHTVFGIETPSYKDRSKYIQDVDGLAKLVTQKDVPTFYASYSMTVATEEIRNKINAAIWRLRAYGVVIDPASIELGMNVEKEHESVIFAYTVCRDLQWDIQKVDVIVAFHPYENNPPLSTGMMDELGHARAFGKDRYLIMPVGSGSPFTRDNYVPSNHVFKTEDAFFNFIEKKRRPVLTPKFLKFQKKFMKWQDSAIKD